METSMKIAILGGGEDELGILSEFHRTPGVVIMAIYDRDPRAVTMEIAEIIGIPTFTDDSFIDVFRKADYIIVTENREKYNREILLLRKDKLKIINPSEAVTCLPSKHGEPSDIEESSWPSHLEEALDYINRITDRDRLLKWLLEIAVRVIEASSGSIMLYSEQSRELYIGYASGLSDAVVNKTRQHLGEGIAGRVAETNIAVLLENTLESPLYKEGRERETIQSAISAPIVYQDTLIGVLNVSTNKDEKELGNKDLETIRMITSKIAPILEQHLRIDAHELREIEFQIRGFLETLFPKETGFHDKFTLLCRFLADRLGADTVTVYTATDEGNWLILGGSDQLFPTGEQSPRIHCIKGTLAKSFLNSETVIMTEANHEPKLDIVRDSKGITSIYLPLVHENPLGVMVIEFSGRTAIERFFKLKDTLRFQVSFFVFSQLREIRQQRRLESLEKLSSITPSLISMHDIARKIETLSSMVSSLIGSAAGSFHLFGPEGQKTAFHNFPAYEAERKQRLEHDADIIERVLENWNPEVLSFLSVDVDMYEKPPLYSSIIAYPLFSKENYKAVFIGYDKIPATSLDSTIFGEWELDLLKKVGEILEPIFTRRNADDQGESPLTFDDLLKSNQKILLEHIQNEIERAERYHHGFTLTLFRIKGLRECFDTNQQKCLSLINKISLGIRTKVRKTDYFSWIETDLFGVLSMESYRRISFLEKRLMEFINGIIEECKLLDTGSFEISSGYGLFPGKSDKAGDIVAEAKSGLEST